MATPTTAIQRFDLSLSYEEFNLRANRRGFIGLKVFPAVGVGLQSAKFLRILVESLLGPIEDTLRKAKSGYKRDDFEWATDEYATQDHGVEEVLDDRTLKQYRNEIRAEQIHRDRAVNRVLMAYEDAVADAVFNTTTWSGAALTTGVVVPWSTPATATPIADVDGAIESVEDSCGVPANTMVITSKALRYMKRTDEIQDLLKYSGFDDPKNLLTLTALAELFSLEQILVARGMKNASDQGQDAVFSRLWDSTMVMIAHIHDSDDLEDPMPRIGCTPMWTEENAEIPGAGDTEMGVVIEEYREDNVRGGIIRARNDRQVKTLHKEAGHLLTAVIA